MNSQIFSNIEFYRNHHFIILMREWNKMLISDETDEMKQEWGGLIKADFYLSAIEWLNKNKDDDFWKTGLE